MPDPSLHSILLQRMRTAFGEPQRIVGDTQHWALGGQLQISAINVLLEGTPDHPTVWVFDPHDKVDGVVNARIAKEAEIDPLIKAIQVRETNNTGRKP